MDPIIDKINEIEKAASRIMDDAAKTNQELDAAHEVRIKAADLAAEEETEKKLDELRQTLQSHLSEAQASLQTSADRRLKELDAYYNANRESLVNSIFDSIIRK